MKRAITLGLGMLVLLAAGQAWGQGVLIVIDPPHPVPLPRPSPWIPPWPPRPPRPPVPPPAPPMTYKIKELALQARIVDQVARVQVSQAFVNTGSRQMEVAFVFPLPYDGAVDQLTFLVDGKEIPGKLLPAAEARTIYESYVRRNEDPALLEWIGTGMFKTSVFPVPPGAERQVNLRYNQLLRKDGNVTDFLFPLSTAQYTSAPVERIAIEASIQSSVEIKSVYSPTHAIDVKRSDDRLATVRFEARNEVPAADFRLFYDVAKGEVGASVLSYRPDPDDDGYFLLLASPKFQAESAQRPAKTTIFVVDRSGSMSGKKMEQAKESLKFVLNNLRPGDTFNIIAYDSSVESFRPELQKYDDETRRAALGFIEGLYAGGATNIDGALSTALEMIQDAKRPTYILFLTDGLPTTGETSEAKIVERSRQQNKHRARLVTLGVGYDVNSRLLDRLARANYGQSEFVRPDEDLEIYVSRLHNRISAPVMTDVKVEVDLEKSKAEDGPPVNRVYPRQVYDLFAGEQLVLVGRYRRPGAAKVVVEGKVGDKTSKFDFPAELIEKSNDESYAFVEKLWAMRRIGEIIEEIDLKGRNEELVQELVALSTKHGILTPYTSFLADENPPPLAAGTRWGFDQARQRLQQLDVAEGRLGFAQRAERRSLQEARIAPQSSGFAMPAADAEAAGFGAGGVGPGAGPAAAPAMRSAPAVRYRDIESDREVAVESVRIVGNETLYKRGNQWFAADVRDVDPSRDADRVKTVERFSDDYFGLIAHNTPAENAVLARQQAGEELIVKLRGQIYRIR